MIPGIKEEFLITAKLCENVGMELRCFANHLEKTVQKELQNNPKVNMEAVIKRIKKVRIFATKLESLI